ncbi:MAG: YciI family protein [Anaerolineae bacterium]|nr:YciI family protein [Anaerolineae bacterium]
MKYVFLAYQDEKQWNAMSTPERDAFENACQANEQDLRQRGYLLAVEGLQSSHTALTVKLVNGQVTLSEGSSAATQGQLTRIFFISAKDLNEAIRVASQMPQADKGSIEVRPVSEFNRPSKSNYLSFAQNNDNVPG